MDNNEGGTVNFILWDQAAELREREEKKAEEEKALNKDLMDESTQNFEPGKDDEHKKNDVLKEEVSKEEISKIEPSGEGFSEEGSTKKGDLKKEVRDETATEWSSVEKSSSEKILNEANLKEEILKEEIINSEKISSELQSRNNSTVNKIEPDKKGSVAGAVYEEKTGERSVKLERITNETRIRLSLNIDGKGANSINTGIGFFDHMLEGFSRHGFFDLKVLINGDLNVDGHHTVEDCGIVLGSAIKEAIGDKKGIKRYGSMILPMDDALVMCAIDLCGRPYLSYEADFSVERIGYLDTELIREFFYAVSSFGMMNLHIKVISGFNSHHIAEAMFKAFGKALDQATMKDERIEDVLSTKGML